MSSAVVQQFIAQGFSSHYREVAGHRAWKFGDSHRPDALRPESVGAPDRSPLIPNRRSFLFDSPLNRLIDFAHNNSVRILSRVAEGRARRRHSNRFAIWRMLVLTPSQRFIESIQAIDRGRRWDR